MMSLLVAIVVLSLLALVCGTLLGFASKRFQSDEDPVIEQVNSVLPQSQCGQCGQPGCRPYAQAVCSGSEKINKCAPGGEQVMLKLAALLGIEPQPLDADGDDTPLNPLPEVAFIDESNCIGCIKCIQACPVDAIVGTTRALHTVVTDLCTGCRLCVAPCPMNCIKMIPFTDRRERWKSDLTAIPLQFIEITSHV